LLIAVITIVCRDRREAVANARSRAPRLALGRGGLVSQIDRSSATADGDPRSARARQ
jgi:hypothetical protein